MKKADTFNSLAALDALWKSCPLDAKEYSAAEFRGWQGSVYGVLKFNQSLQSQFQEVALKIVERGTDFQPFYDGFGSFDVARDDPKLRDELKAILGQALNDLIVPAPLTALTDEETFGWFWHHCTWKAKIRFMTIVCAIVFPTLGFLIPFTYFAGQNDRFNRVYEVMTTPPANAVQKTTTEQSPTKKETDQKTDSAKLQSEEKSDGALPNDSTPPDATGAKKTE